MEIDITDFVNSEDPRLYSASRVELGDNAAKITWNAAMSRGAEPPVMLDDADKLQALRDHVKWFGAWDEAEIAAWSDVECNALFIQLISGDMREADMTCGADEFDWERHEKNAAAGRVSGRIGQGDDGHVYYYLGD